MKIGTLLSRTSKGGGRTTTGHYQEFFGDEIAVVIDVVERVPTEVTTIGENRKSVILLGVGSSVFAYTVFDFDMFWRILVSEKN